MNLGKYPWLCMAMWLAFLPSEFWERITGKQGVSDMLGPTPKWLEMLALAIIIIIVYGNLRSYKFIDKIALLSKVQSLIRVNQGWNTFSGPPKVTDWLVADARLKDGSSVDIYAENDSVSFLKPENYAARFPNQNHIKLSRKISKPKSREYLRDYAEWKIKSWDKDKDLERNIDSVSF